MSLAAVQLAARADQELVIHERARVQRWKVRIARHKAIGHPMFLIGARARLFRSLDRGVGAARRWIQPPPTTFAAAARRRSSAQQVLLLPPNLVCHFRLVLALFAAHAASTGSSGLSVALFAASLALDAVDGWLARRLGQSTNFGAFLDVLVDIVTRGLLWCVAAGGHASLWPWAGALPALEGAVFACTHATGGAAWKTGCFR